MSLKMTSVPLRGEIIDFTPGPDIQVPFEHRLFIYSKVLLSIIGFFE